MVCQPTQVSRRAEVIRTLTLIPSDFVRKIEDPISGTRICEDLR